MWKAVLDKNSCMGGSVSKFTTCADRILKYKLRGFAIEGDPHTLGIVQRLAAYDSDDSDAAIQNNRLVASKATVFDEVFSVLRKMRKEVPPEERGERREWYESVLDGITKSLCECVERRDDALVPLIKRAGLEGITKGNLRRLAMRQIDIKMDGNAKTRDEIAAKDVDVLVEIMGYAGFLKHGERRKRKKLMLELDVSNL